MNRFTPLLSAILIAVMATLATAQKAVTPKANGPELFALEDLRPGMKGTARTVFSGSDTEEFGVEVLGILPGFPGPRQSAIIAKLSGANVEKTGVFAGMSGSPVYIDGKLVGAIAFSFPFSKEPIAGITPIKQMIDLFNKGSENLKPKEPRVVSFSQLAGTDWKPNLPKPAVSSQAKRSNPHRARSVSVHTWPRKLRYSVSAPSTTTELAKIAFITGASRMPVRNFRIASRSSAKSMFACTVAVCRIMRVPMLPTDRMYGSMMP